MIHQTALTLCLLAGATLAASAQHVDISLSERHEHKLNHARNARDRLMLYYRFYKKDSLKDLRVKRKEYRTWARNYWRKMKDHNRLSEAVDKKAGKLRRNTNLKPLSEFYRSSTDFSDSSLAISKDGIDSLQPDSFVDHYNIEGLINRHYPGTVQGKQFAMKHFRYPASELPGVWPGGQGKVDSMDKLVQSGRHFSDSIRLKTIPSLGNIDSSFVRTNLLRVPGGMADNTSDWFAGRMEVINSARTNISRLLSRYRSFVNSEDPASAIKYSSMKGKSLKERLVMGANFNLVSTQPLSLDISPAIGYKFTSLFEVGVAVNYRFSPADNTNQNFSSDNTSMRLFSGHEVTGGFRMYAEWERSPGSAKSEEVGRRWKDQALVGIGKKVLIHPKVYLTITALYNLNEQAGEDIYPKRFMVRTGFQISELATRKKVALYHPNRSSIN